MEFKQFIRIITEIFNISSENLLKEWIADFKNVAQKYEEKYTNRSPLKSLEGRKMDSFFDPEIFEEYQEILYRLSLYWINKWDWESIELIKVQEIFEKEGIDFIENIYRKNFYLLLQNTFPDCYDMENVRDNGISGSRVLDTEEIAATCRIHDRIIYSEETLFYSEFESMKIDEMKIRVPYKEIYGIQANEKTGFYEGENFHMEYILCRNFDDSDPGCKNCVQKQHIKTYLVDTLGIYTEKEFQERVKEKRKQGFLKNYDRHPAKLKITRFRKSKFYRDKMQYRLAIEFGCSDYLEHLVYQDVLMENEQVQKDFIDDIRNFPESAQFNERDTVWTRMGSGIWIVTKDNYLMVSLNQQIVLREVTSSVSYSSYGGLDRKLWNHYDKKYEDGTPERGVREEVMMEMDINEDTSSYLEKPELISFGINLINGIWMQLSFFARCNLNMEEIKKGRMKYIDMHENCIFFIPFTEDAVKALLRNAKIEPGAEYSLYKIYKLKINS